MLINNSNTNNKKGLGLSSGGLDSILAAHILQRQGIYVEWICFETPFFSSKKAAEASQITGIPLIVKNISEQYIEMLKNPNRGFGKNMNPCIDCHLLMFRLAGDYMKENNFQFLFSGEVLGQRPMSQNKSSLRYIEKNSNYNGHIIRPLSAKKMPVTIPEQNGIVLREKLLDITGRSRKIQIQLAKEFGIKKYPAPSGGCLLTDSSFSRRLKDLFENEQYYELRDFELLKYGRHIRFEKNIKLIVGKTKIDNENISKLYNNNKDLLIYTPDIPGPVLLITNIKNKKFDNIKQVCSICIGYSKAKDSRMVNACVTTPDDKYIIKTYGMNINEIKNFILF